MGAKEEMVEEGPEMAMWIDDDIFGKDWCLFRDNPM